MFGSGKNDGDRCTARSVRGRANDAPHVPCLGLSTFHSDDAEWFFGRAKLVEELRARIADNYFFTVFAASGAGKSSLLRILACSWCRRR
ncbi:MULTISPECIES: nSTAND1 domain-containing NTPase [Micromonospora]|uniref:nSTAND1 domain-containing NTPase n=1 Tax=Micromonospora TaxID=1873 RepID=UPI003557984B